MGPCLLIRLHDSTVFTYLGQQVVRQNVLLCNFQDLEFVLGQHKCQWRSSDIAMDL
jgi:hypothetical protein